MTDSAESLTRTLAETRATVYEVSVTPEHRRTLADILARWNEDRRLRRLEPLTPEQALSAILRAVRADLGA